MGIVLHTLAALGYAVLGLRPWRALLGNASTVALWPERVGLALVLVLHAAALYVAMVVPQGVRLGLGLALSSTIWLGMLVFYVESLMIRVDGVRLLLLPLAAVATLMPVLLPAPGAIENLSTPWLGLHLLLSLAAYGIITIAAMHALLMAVADRHLHQPQTTMPSERAAGAWTRLFDALPPLLVLEHVLFSLIWLGFVLLTLSVLTGIAMSISQGAGPLPADHKTIFTLLAWITFGVLLTGRQIWGWRGRTAVRYTLIGLAWLVLAYAGSRFVLEVILQR